MSTIIKWRAINGYEGLYEVSNIGEVRQIGTGLTLRHNLKFKTTYVKQSAYGKPYNCLIVKLKNQIGQEQIHRVHALVFDAFSATPRKKQQTIYHINGDHYDNRIKNLSLADPNKWIPKDEHVVRQKDLRKILEDYTFSRQEILDLIAGKSNEN
jgi:hypothetical protein